ncbi:MAG: divergent PAP2 family protein [Bacillota bacterium]
MNFLFKLFNNNIFLSGFMSWFLAQFFKIFTKLLKTKEFDLTRFVGSGGMPSSHSSLVMGVSTAIGLKYGFSHDAYVTSLIFSLIVMYDASGVRRAVGKQAIIINRLIKNYYNNKSNKDIKLKELVGHTPVEVIAGAFLGIIIANYLY